MKTKNKPVLPKQATTTSKKNQNKAILIFSC
uniref:Uncharacterized protein n=1 Tax=Anguilla anguilla TaxID=7936 RepID=A0A0E9QNY4_ANGAN